MDNLLIKSKKLSIFINHHNHYIMIYKHYIIISYVFVDFIYNILIYYITIYDVKYLSTYFYYYIMI